MQGRWLMLAGLLYGVAAAQAAPPPGFVVRQSLALEPARHGIRGSIELIQDARLQDDTPVWGNATDRALAGRALQGVRLRVLDAAGRVIDEQGYTAPVATLEAVDLQGDGRPTYLLRADYGSGSGGYFGLVTFPLELRAGRLQRLTAEDEGGSERLGDDEKGLGMSEPIVLTSAFRSGWVLVADGAARAILVARSRPHLEDPLVREGLSGDSVVLFQTYRFRDGHWHRWERRMIGEWEDGGEDSWPDMRLFP